MHYKYGVQVNFQAVYILSWKLYVMCVILKQWQLSVKEFSSGSSYNAEASPFTSIQHSDVSLSLSPANSLQIKILAPMKNAMIQNKEMKKLLEECSRKVKDHELKLQQLQAENIDCTTETLRLQVTIVNMHSIIFKGTP